MTVKQLRTEAPPEPRPVGLPVSQYAPKVITCPEDARTYVAPVYDICGWCLRSRPQFTKCTCGIAERVASAKRQAEEQGRVPRFGPRPGDKIRCPDCPAVTPPGGSHDCPGPKPDVNAFSVHAINDRHRREGLIAELKELGLLDEGGKP